MADTLLVYWNTILVGFLEQYAARLSFRYDSQYLSRTGVLPLSRHLPVQKEAFGHNAALAFFANLLPEGAIRRQVARQVGVSAENVFGLLAAIGGDCAGAVSLLPPGMSSEDIGAYHPISREKLAKELANLPAHPFLAGDEGVRLSLAGAQNKLPIYYDGREFFIPEGQYPSSHILKTAITQLDDSVSNEAFCIALARKALLPVPQARIVDINGTQVYLVERYDRISGADGTLERLHQEDFCQALGVPPEMKYEAEGGPGFKDCFKLVEEWSDEPIVDSLLLLDWALFNLLIGNADSHAKNLSLLYAGGTIRLAPFYDLLSTAVYERVNNKFAMKLGGQRNLRYLTPNHLARFAEDIGVELRTVKNRMKDLADRVNVAVDVLRKDNNSGLLSTPIVISILRVIEQRKRKLEWACQPDCVNDFSVL
jgi:serine/threonine-protein kinase HipA